VDVYLIDGTYELFRISTRSVGARADGREVARSRRADVDARHDQQRHALYRRRHRHVIESFPQPAVVRLQTGAHRSDLYAQFRCSRRRHRLGIATWPMVDTKPTMRWRAGGRGARPRVQR